ncbi:hypothetical protein [Sphingomonas sp. UYAg733]
MVLQVFANGTDASRFSAALPAQNRDFVESIAADMATLWKGHRLLICSRGAERRMCSLSKGADKPWQPPAVANALAPSIRPSAARVGE